MKYIKTYENLTTDEPKIGDYVTCREEQLSSPNAKQIANFINSNIAKIIDLEYDSGIITYLVQFNNIPEKLKVVEDYTVMK